MSWIILIAFVVSTALIFTGLITVAGDIIHFITIHSIMILGMIHFTMVVITVTTTLGDLVGIVLTSLLGITGTVLITHGDIITIMTTTGDTTTPTRFTIQADMSMVIDAQAIVM